MDIEQVREELDEHLDAINSNTRELQASFDYVAEVEAKVDKLSEKLDTIMRMLEQQPREHLNIREQEVFLILYQLEQFMSYQEIGQRLMLPQNTIQLLVDALIAKGIPILKRHEGSQVKIQIDPSFREQQTKENLLNINEQVMSSVAQFSR